MKSLFRGAALILLAGLGLVSGPMAQPEPETDGLQRLAADFWAWRAETQPLSGDDITRIERPPQWVPDWSPRSVSQRREALGSFRQRWEILQAPQPEIAGQVDYRLIGSAIARVEWELDVQRNWRRNPVFYIDQTLGSLFEILLQPPPFSPERSRQFLARLEQIPHTLRSAPRNLDQMTAPFVRLAIHQLRGVEERLSGVMQSLQPLLAAEVQQELPLAAHKAFAALVGYRRWLEARINLSNRPVAEGGLAELGESSALGRDAYQFFLRKVALIPYEPEELIRMARQEWERSVALEAFEKSRNRELPELTLFEDQVAQIKQAELDEKAVRSFLEEKEILTVPEWVRHYRNLPIPEYLVPLAFWGVTDDLTSPRRLDQDAVSYIWPPAPDLSYFALSTAKDPRPIIVHEGVPGHYFQMALSWAQENPIRRFYYDSAANEGLGFYSEEMLLQHGLFDDRPRVREIIYNFMRLRALRVEVDVKLALGEMSIPEAADYLEKAVPMDRQTAQWEAAFFASTPGQAISYQIGKLQILQFLADAKRVKGENFSLRDFHDFLWKNGNVPIALLRWEYTGLSDQIDKLE